MMMHCGGNIANSADASHSFSMLARLMYRCIGSSPASHRRRRQCRRSSNPFACTHLPSAQCKFTPYASVRECVSVYFHAVHSIDTCVRITSLNAQTLTHYVRRMSHELAACYARICGAVRPVFPFSDERGTTICANNNNRRLHYDYYQRLVCCDS